MLLAILEIAAGTIVRAFTNDRSNVILVTGVGTAAIPVIDIALHYRDLFLRDLGDELNVPSVGILHVNDIASLGLPKILH